MTKFQVLRQCRFVPFQKKKGAFHHSSFLAGGTALSAGRLVAAQHGILKFTSAYNGHYRPTEECLQKILSFHGPNLDEVQVRTANEDYEHYDTSEFKGRSRRSESTEVIQTETKGQYQRTLPREQRRKGTAKVAKKAIMQRINSKKAARTFIQLGHQLSLKWTTGLGQELGALQTTLYNCGTMP